MPSRVRPSGLSFERRALSLTFGLPTLLILWKFEVVFILSAGSGSWIAQGDHGRLVFSPLEDSAWG